jgi:UDP-N-acetyl-D-glucosamine dehydrogenase
MNESAQQLLSKIENHDAVIGIIGLGYVGLPLALAFAEKGFPVLGFDVDPVKVEKINRGECYIKHLDPTRLTDLIGHPKSPRLQATTDFSRLSEADAILICVPTPLGSHKEPNLSYVENSTKAIKESLRPGQLIVLESTTYPGTTDELLLPILESEPESWEGGGNSEFRIPNSKFMKCGTHFFLAFSPEREDPGNPSYGATNTPKVLGGVDVVSGDLAQTLYDQIVERTVRVSSARTAEATKLMENVFRAVNIALVNELKIIFDRMDIDIWEALDAAETKPFGFMRFNPGPGWGGHCIPLDPFYLAWKARESGVPTKFIELAGEINTRMPDYVIEKLQLALNERSKTLNGARILVLGLAYKRDIDDPRESPAFELIHRLLTLGADVAYHDPHIPKAPSMRSWPDLPPMTSQPLTQENLQSIDAVLLATDHQDVDYHRHPGCLP